MADRLLTPAVLLLALSLCACSTTAVESPSAPAQAPPIVALFSPTSVTGESIRDETIRRIDQTAHSLDLAMYSFNEPTLTEALIRAKARSVSMRVILDALQAGSSTSQADELRKAGVTVKLMRGIKGNGIMHHKVALYDGAVVQTGSFNWTDNASCCSWEKCAVHRGSGSGAALSGGIRGLWNRHVEPVEHQQLIPVQAVFFRV